MRYFLFLMIFLTSASLWAQKDYQTTQDISKKIKKKYREAFSSYNAFKYKEAIKQLDKIQKKAPRFVNAYLLEADCYLLLKDWEKAKVCFEQALEIAPDYKPISHYRLGQLAMQSATYVEAGQQLSLFLEKAPKNNKLRPAAERLLADARFRPQAMANPVPFQPQNMGPNINSHQREYFPSVTANEKKMVFNVLIGEGRQAQEDLYQSFKVNGEWTPAKPLPEVNTPENEGAQSISADGQYLVFTVCNRPGDFGSCDLYYCVWEGQGWSRPQNMGPNINTGNWESQPSLSANAQTLYFTRGGARNQGDKDLWMSYRNLDGSWGTPQPLSELNTDYDETAPCIHPDGQTLYFSSEGYPGMGKKDLFISRKGEDGKWGKPLNLGYPINTEGIEEAIVVGLSGELAYLAAERAGGYGSLDLYSFELPEALRPKAVTYLEAHVFDAETKANLAQALVYLIDLEAQDTVCAIRTNAEGKFLLCLPLGQDYALHVKEKGYLFASEHFELSAANSRQTPYQLPLPLQALKANPSKTDTVAPILLKNVFFATNSASLQPSSRAELEQLRSLLLEQPKMRIRLQGHTDNEGEQADNLALSQRRAEAVRQYLIERGIAADRLEAQGFGESRPIANNNTAEGRQANRRTEFLPLN